MKQKIEVEGKKEQDSNTKDVNQGDENPNVTLGDPHSTETQEVFTT